MHLAKFRTVRTLTLDLTFKIPSQTPRLTAWLISTDKEGLPFSPHRPLSCIGFIYSATVNDQGKGDIPAILIFLLNSLQFLSA